jgi:Rieske Fe-S protein
VVRLAEGNEPSSFTAVQSACTHENGIIAYSANQGRFICPNHGSQFSTTGAVQNGPATSSLKKYAVSISGTTLTITG